MAFFWLLGSGWLAGIMLNLSQRHAPNVEHPPLRGRVALVVLGGGTRYDRNHLLVPQSDAVQRLVKVAALYRQCRASAAYCTVIVRGGNPQHHRRSEANDYAPYLLASGVAPADLVLERQSQTTYDNARRVAPLLGRGHYDYVVLVTSAFHMRRAMLSFGSFGISAVPVVSNVRQPVSSFWPNAANLTSCHLALHEALGTLRFYVWRALGWY